SPAQRVPDVPLDNSARFPGLATVGPSDLRLIVRGGAGATCRAIAPRSALGRQRREDLRDRPALTVGATAPGATSGRFVVVLVVLLGRFRSSIGLRGGVLPLRGVIALRLRSGPVCVR